MDSQGKQRLTGAIILVALFVLLVPELLTGPGDAHPPAGNDIEAGMRQHTIDLDSGERTPSKPAATDNSAVTLPPVAPMDATPDIAQPGEAAAPAQIPAPTSNPMAPPPPATVVQAPAAATPPATPNQRPEPGTFVVQLGTFGEKQNADRLVRDMKARGFAAFSVPVTTNGRELFRVRVGPVRDRASAEALAAELKKAGQSGSIVPIS